jgi:hypothetical protein
LCEQKMLTADAVCAECGVSVTCEGSPEWGMVWWVTRESGRLPLLCEQSARAVEISGGSLEQRRRPAVLVLKFLSRGREVEVLVAPPVRTNVEWVMGEVTEGWLDYVRVGEWSIVVQLCDHLTGSVPCPRRCDGACKCPEQQLWELVRWRRALVPELGSTTLPRWWNGLSDGVGRMGRELHMWLRCPCGADHGRAAQAEAAHRSKRARR